MTKKSLARQERDAKEKKTKPSRIQLQNLLRNNTAWDDLNKTRDSIFELLNYDSQIFGVFFSQEPLMGLVSAEQRPRVISSLATLKEDVVTLLQIHQSIASKHAVFTGAVKTEQEGLLSHECYTEYLEITARFDQLDKAIVSYLHGVLIDVTDKVREIEAKLAAKQEATKQPQQQEVINDISI